jgi:nitrate/nitrite transporter NarK
VSKAALGLVVGIALGFAGAFGGFGAFVVVLALGAVGFLIGRYFDGELDVSELIGGERRRR